MQHEKVISWLQEANDQLQVDTRCSGSLTQLNLSPLGGNRSITQTKRYLGIRQGISGEDPGRKGFDCVKWRSTFEGVLADWSVLAFRKL